MFLPVLSAHAFSSLYQIRAELDPVLHRLLGTVRIEIQADAVLAQVRLQTQDLSYLHHQEKILGKEGVLLNHKSGKFKLASLEMAGHRIEVAAESEDWSDVRIFPPIPSGSHAELVISYELDLAPILGPLGYWEEGFRMGHWYPKLASERASAYDVKITVPNHYELGAGGRKVSEQRLEGGKKTLEFRTNSTTHFAWGGGGGLRKRVANLGRVEVRALARDERQLGMVDRALKVLEYLPKRLGEFPYDEMTLVESYYSGNAVFPRLALVESSPAELDAWYERSLTRIQESKIAKHLARQWFPGWPGEGIATYLEQSYMKEIDPGHDNLIRFTPYLRFSVTQAYDLMWRYHAPGLLTPIDAEESEFLDPRQYDAAQSSLFAAMLRHYESMVGRERTDLLLRHFHRSGLDRKTDLESWLKSVEVTGGSKNRSMWAEWLTRPHTSDYSIEKIESFPRKVGGKTEYDNRVTIRQKGTFTYPVVVEATDKKGFRYRGLVDINPGHPSVDQMIHTQAAIDDVVVDPDRQTWDEDRFNNSHSITKARVWPFGTRTLEDDATVLAPLPYVRKRPGLGVESGLFLAGARYLQAYGTLSFGYDWRHQTFNTDAEIQSLRPMRGVGWEGAYVKNALTHRGHAHLAKESSGPSLLKSVHRIQFGPEHFGDLGDRFSAWGIGAKYSFGNLKSTDRFRFGLTVSESFAYNFEETQKFNRLYGVVDLVIPLWFYTSIVTRATYGDIFGTPGRSGLYSLQAKEEGGMRFDSGDAQRFYVSRLETASLEFNLGVPYGRFVDSLQFIRGPTWEAYAFTDVSNSRLRGEVLFDVGFGTRFDLAMGTSLRPRVEVEVTAYENANPEPGFPFPLLEFSLTSPIF